MTVPAAAYAVIGGSGTLGTDFPGALNQPDVTVLEQNLVFDTPYGTSPAFTLFTLGDKRVLTCRMHGWRSGVGRADASRQLFWVLREAGVKKIIAEGGVGSINHLLDLRDIVVPTDYIDQSVRKDVGLEGHYLLVMRQAICPDLHRQLVTAAGNQPLGRVFPRGVYMVTDGRHFESPAEIAMYRGHGDIVGQSLCPEVYLAREIGACYAGVYLVVNYGEGVVKDWRHADLADIFQQDAPRMGLLVLDALRAADATQTCGCPALRKSTLLKKVYGGKDSSSD
nr:MTAP family purine nucleoside phosphorylase [Acetonema longum]